MTYPATYEATYTDVQPPVPPAIPLAIPANVAWLSVNDSTVTTISPWVPDPNGPPDVTPWYVPYSGFVERLPQAWDDLYRGVVQATINDAWFACNFAPNPILYDEILNDGPYAYWACTDAAGNTSASNYAAGNVNPLLQVNSKYGAAGITATFGQNSSALLGAQATTIVATDLRVTSGGGMWQMDGWTSSAAATEDTPATPLYNGVSLACTDGNFPDISSGITVEFWMQPTALPGSPLLASPLTLSFSGKVVLQVVMSLASGQLSVTGYGPAGSSASATVATAPTTALTHLALTVTQDVIVIYADGVLAGVFNWAHPLYPSFSTLELCGQAVSQVRGLTVSPGYYDCYTAHVAVYGYVLEPARILTHYQAGITAMAGEPAYARIERLLQAGSATGRRVILAEAAPEADAVVSCQDIPGQPASASISNITGDLLPGVFLVAPTGDLFYLSKDYAWNQPARWLLGDDAANGEYPFSPRITFDYDPSRVINEIQLTQLDSQAVVVPSVSSVEAASQGQYGTISDLATGYLEGDGTQPLNFGPGLPDLANWLACTYAAPSLRLTGVTVDAASYPAAWPFVLCVSPGDMVICNYRYFSESPLISLTGRVSQVKRSLRYSDQGVSGYAECVIDPAPEANCLTTDDPVKGLLDGTSNILGW